MVLSRVRTTRLQSQQTTKIRVVLVWPSLAGWRVAPAAGVRILDSAAYRGPVSQFFFSPVDLARRRRSDSGPARW